MWPEIKVMWSVRGQYVVGKGGRYVAGTIVMWSVSGQYVVSIWYSR